MTFGDQDKTDYEELREEIEAGIEKSKRLVARSRELIAAVAGAEDQEEPEPPAIAPGPKPPNPAAG